MVAPFVLGAALEIAKIAAPGLVKWLSGSDKAAEVAEQLVTVAQEVTGTQSGDAAAAALRANPDLVLQLKTRAAELEAQLDMAYLADVQNARNMAIEVQRAAVELQKAGIAPGVDRKNAMILGDVLGLITCIAVLVYAPDLPGEVRGIIGTVAGFFGIGLRDAHQFEFGSSRDSREKTQLLARADPIR